MKCENCLYNKNCQFIASHRTAQVEEYTAFEDKSEWIHLPCKIGTTVYRVCKKKYDVDGYGMQWFEDWGVVTNRFDLCMLKEIGKMVFLTREEAEKVLEEKEIL